MTATRGAVFACSAFVLCLPQNSRAQTIAQCSALLVTRGIPATRQTADPCLDLSAMIYAGNARVVAAANVILTPDMVLTPRDLQAQNSLLASTAGTLAQGSAIPGVQPAGVAAGTIAMVGTKAGQDAIAALGLNPAVLFIGDEVSKQLAKYSRFADVTLFIPVSKLATEAASNSSDAKLKYFGARLRLNITGLSAGDQIWDGANVLLGNWIRAAGRNQERVRNALAKAPDFTACAVALLDNLDVAHVTAGCGSEVVFEVNAKEAEQLRTAFSRIRNKADEKYFGADIRVDVGDPTLGATSNAAGTSLYAGVGAGRRILATSGDGSVGIRTRLGVRHAKLDSEATAEFASEGGLGFEIARTTDGQEINASGGVEFRYGNASAAAQEALQTNFVMLRGSLSIPVVNGSSVSINFGTPITGKISPTLSVNFNWGLLLSDALKH